MAKDNELRLRGQRSALTPVITMDYFTTISTLRLPRHKFAINAPITILFITITILVDNLQTVHSDPFTPSSESPNEVDSCEACKILVKSFDKGLEATSRGKHEGGDTSWEERNLKSYPDSEVRLVEIQETLCEDATKGKAQCFSLAEDSETLLEDWWFNHRRNNVRLKDFLCINKLKRCCPEGKFGPNCLSCRSDCNMHGSCDGSGTRNGTGNCNCQIEYMGDDCEQCDKNYFRVAQNDNQFTCLPCDLACQGCHGPGKMNCTECRVGYHYQDKEGCIDINECDVGIDANGDTKLCKGNTYCLNTDGYYRCADCHEACVGCLDYGADRCLSCGPGYELDKDHYCRTEEELDRLEQQRSEEAWDQNRTILSKVLYDLGYLVCIVVLLFNVTFRNVSIYTIFIYGAVLGFILNLSFHVLTNFLDIPENTRMSSE